VASVGLLLSSLTTDSKAYTDTTFMSIAMVWHGGCTCTDASLSWSFYSCTANADIHSTFSKSGKLNSDRKRIGLLNKRFSKIGDKTWTK